MAAGSAYRAWAWWWQLSWPALRQQWGRQFAALLTIALGLALAGAVHWINASALAQFEAATRASSAQADLELRAAPGAAPLDLALYQRLSALDAVSALAPRVEGQWQGRDAQGRPLRLRLMGVDLLQLPSFYPQWRLRSPQQLSQALRGPGVFGNAAARQALGGDAEAAALGERLGLPWLGELDSEDPSPLLLMDIAWAQPWLQRPQALDAILLQLRPGRTAADLGLSPQVQASPPAQQASAQAEEARRLTSAYRLNLSVLSLMALLVGGFMVFAVHSLSVAQRLPQLALLGVLGMGEGQRRAWLACEAALLGLVGGLLGWGLALGLAELALWRLGGDLGAGLMGSTQAAPALRALWWEQLILVALGPLVSLAAAALPLQRLRALPAAQVLKGLGQQGQAWSGWWSGLAGLIAALLLLLAPTQAWASYLAMLALLLGGLAAVPALLRRLARAWQPLLAHRALPLLALQRVRDQSAEAARLVAGVLVALSLSVAMLVMVASFRQSLDDWLDRMLPADLYLRQPPQGQQPLPLPAAWLDGARQLEGVRQILPQRSTQVGLDAQNQEQALTLLARPLSAPDRLPLVARASGPLPAQALPVYANEALRDQQQLRPGDSLLLHWQGRPISAVVAGVWRDYSHQSPALLTDHADWQRLSGDTAWTELALYLHPGADESVVQAGLRAMARGRVLEIASAAELRRLSLALFDRSFAITYWLQAVGLGLGLFGVAASLSAQLLARRREFGLLLHLGLTRRDLAALLLGETLAQSVVGALLGLLVGLALSAVLVLRLNPQSFHWSMDWILPGPPLLALLGATLLACLLTAAWAALRVVGPDQGEALRAVREDW
jgi:putative ABC transport system permease protein